MHSAFLFGSKNRCNLWELLRGLAWPARKLRTSHKIRDQSGTTRCRSTHERVEAHFNQHTGQGGRAMKHHRRAPSSSPSSSCASSSLLILIISSHSPPSPSPPTDRNGQLRQKFRHRLGRQGPVHLDFPVPGERFGSSGFRACTSGLQGFMALVFWVQGFTICGSGFEALRGLRMPHQADKHTPQDKPLRPPHISSRWLGSKGTSGLVRPPVTELERPHHHHHRHIYDHHPQLWCAGACQHATYQHHSRKASEAAI